MEQRTGPASLEVGAEGVGETCPGRRTPHHCPGRGPLGSLTTPRRALILSRPQAEARGWAAPYRAERSNVLNSFLQTTPVLSPQSSDHDTGGPDGPGQGWPRGERAAPSRQVVGTLWGLSRGGRERCRCFGSLCTCGGSCLGRGGLSQPPPRPGRQEASGPGPWWEPGYWAQVDRQEPFTDLR